MVVNDERMSLLEGTGEIDDYAKRGKEEEVVRFLQP
jgi:hypothetical protein